MYQLAKFTILLLFHSSYSYERHANYLDHALCSASFDDNYTFSMYISILAFSNFFL